MPVLLVIASLACAQQYPGKPVRIVVGFPPGGAVDILARAAAPRLAESLGQQFIVDNRPGASSTIAADIVAKAPPDGYTLVMVSAAHAVNPSLYSAMPHVHAGKLRALGVTSAKRLEAAPDVPTIAEAGLPGFAVIGWYGLLAPTGTPKEIVARLSAEMERVMRLPDVGQRLASEGVDPVGSAPDVFASAIRTDIAKWGEVVRASGAKVD